MGAVRIVNGAANLRRFADLCQKNPESDRQALLRQGFVLTDGDVETLTDSGVFDMHADGNLLMEQHQRLAAVDLERVAAERLCTLSDEYGVPQTLEVSLFPLTEPDWMQAQGFGGAHRYVTLEGHLHLFVKPGPVLPPALTSTATHEFHHFWRMALIGGLPATVSLVEIVVYEGLAEHFVHETLGADSVGEWARYLTDGEVDALRPVFDAVWDVTDDATRNEYLLGSFAAHPERWQDYMPYQSAKEITKLSDGSMFIPLWAGYSLGYHLVRRYHERHPDLSLSELTGLPSRVFLT
jgi:uncharacterized protein YjaZ